MQNKAILTKALAIAGTVLVWLPIAAPVLLALPRLLTRPVFRLDWLMPAELFPVALTGGALLIWAALRARSRAKLITLVLAIAVISLIGGQALAVVTGMASGETEPTGWPWAVVVASIASYTLALTALGICGILLLHDLFRRPESLTATG